jgi:DNA polymerase-3 subunit delta'
VHRLLARYHTDERVRARKAMDLGIDVIRQFVIEPASRTAQMRGVKVFIIEDADRLTVPAQNALLKTLEEPPVGTTLILISRGLDAMLETTRSRCQLVRFGGLPAPFIADQVHATAPDLDPKAAGFLSRHASGSLGTAVRLAEDGVVETNAVVVKALASLRRFDALDVAKMVLDQADELAKVIKSRQPDSSDSDLKRQALICLLSLVATFYRDVLHLACAPDASITNDAQRQSVVAVAGQGGAERARVAIDDIVRAEADLQVNANSTLAIERLCIHLARKAPCAAI